MQMAQQLWIWGQVKMSGNVTNTYHSSPLQQFHVLSESLDDVAPAEHTKNTNNTSGLWDVFAVWDALRIVISDVWFEADTINPKCIPSLLSLLHAIDKGIIHGLHHLMILVTSHKGKEWLQTQNVFAKLVVTP